MVRLKTESKTKAGRTLPRGLKSLGEGLWLVRVYFTCPKTGRAKESERRVEASSPEEAALIRRNLKLRLEAGGGTEAKRRSTIGEVADEWLGQRVTARRKDGRTRLAPATIERYSYSVEAWIKPFLGDYIAERLDRSDVLKWRDTLARHLAAATVNGHLRVLKTMLLESLEVVLRVEFLEEDDQRISDDEPNLLEAEEAARFLAEAERSEPEHYPMLFWLIATAQRFGTARAMRWDDLDRAAGVAYARRRLSGSAGEVLEGTKTGRLRRDVVPVPAELLAVLDRYRAGFSKKQRESGWLFPSSTGGLKSSTVLAEPIRGICERIGLGRRLTPHGLRRTAAKLYRLAASDTVAMSVAGHLTSAMHRHYAPVGAAEKRDAGSAVLRLIHGGNEGFEANRESNRESEEATEIRSAEAQG